MLRNYLVVALRNLLRAKLYALIHVWGLAIGIACCLLILLYIQDQLRYGAIHPKGDRIYRILRESKLAGSGEEITAGASTAIVPAMLADFPEVEAAFRILNWGVWINYKDKQLHRSFCLADAAILEMLDLPLVQGDSQTALSEPNTLLISEKAALEFFAAGDPIGEMVKVDNDKLGGEYIITGIFKEIGRHAHTRFDFLSAAPSTQTSEWFRSQWDIWNIKTSWRPFGNYIMLREGQDPRALEAKLPDFIERHLGEEWSKTLTYHLQPLNRIHLYSEVDYGLGSRGDITYLYQMGLIGILIILIACVNFMNLATAQSAGRASEVGLRKVMGAQRWQLMRQFLGESLLITLVALLIGLVLALLALPEFNAFMGSDLSLDVGEISVLLALLVIGLIAGFISGSYPAFFLAAFEPAETLKGKSATRSSGLLRRCLVVFQFTVSGVLLISAAVVYQQTDFMKNKPVGYNKDLLVDVPILHHPRNITASKATIKRAFLDHPNVLRGTLCWPPPGGWTEKHGAARG